ncbi:MAG: hypothetical protein ACE5JM_12280 [Armatimonadota bacterium]
MSRQVGWGRIRPHAVRRRIIQMRILWFTLAGIAVLAILRGSAQTITDGYRTSAGVLQLEEELGKLQREHDKLQGRLELLRTPEGKRLEAAHQFKVVRPGEHLLTMRQDDETRAAMSSFDARRSRSEQPVEVLKRLVRSPRKQASGDQ